MKAYKINHLKNKLISPNGFLRVNFLHFVIEIFFHKFLSFLFFFFKKQIQNNFKKLPQLLRIWKDDCDF
jgi:hypothetical protein